MQMNRKWIPGYEDKYFATWDGHIYRQLKTGRIKELKGYVKGNTYNIKLTINNVSREYCFNRIIWETFKGEIPEGFLVIRKISVLTENGMHNLTLRSKKQHGKKTGPKSRSQAVELLSEDGSVIDSWASARKAAKDLFVSYQTIIDICNKKVKKKPIVKVRWGRKDEVVSQ
ncbi:hypothetical protein A5819_003584 [Enterococcus sp. 7E2_DIV0204]|uniref:hypothetical protein n=1 Tax=unclassified Enterococcus TaxID=2608891 RepID=UPI000A331A03|nr:MULTISPECIES: hypothetical protein [unclassified Enterococcus]OTN84034.1 hypothetical protein A5819_003584 [Enterococcus sp. 7E2_DIV0204]OTP47183.1 hypothetical protein A5884_003558 [Enterococcus sp. 7D2_DIV0200]